MRHISSRARGDLTQVLDERDLRILMLGLDAAEKASIISKLKLGDIQSTKPTIGFNVETIHYKNVNFTIWDVGAQHKTRSLWRHYFLETQGLIWVVNANDPEKLAEARDELRSLMLDPDLQSVAILVLANNENDNGGSNGSDIVCNASMNVAQLTEKLQLSEYGRKAWFVQTCCATSGEGLFEGLEWLATATRRKNATKTISALNSSKAHISEPLSTAAAETKTTNAFRYPMARSGARIPEKRELHILNSAFGSRRRHLFSGNKISSLHKVASCGRNISPIFSYRSIATIDILR